ncbi:MAG: hypothetical protein JJU00_14385 [Opitutales bacterium]|nr:hypothetical protein [Opitutales bacterium]
MPTAVNSKPMELEIQPLARKSFVSGREFEPGQRIESFLYRGEDGGLVRADVLAGETGDFAVRGNLICRWGQTVKDRSDPEADARKSVMQSAEAVFLALFDEPEEGAEAVAEQEAPEEGAAEAEKERALLRHLLALMLERRRVLRRTGRGRYWHPKEKRAFTVPDVEIVPERLLALQDQLAHIIEPQTA